MKFLLSALVFFAVVPSHGAIMSVQGGLGMVTGLFHLNIDVDYQKKKSHSVGGFFIYGAGNEEGPNVTRSSFMALGGDVKVFFGPKRWKVYVAPGFGILSAEYGGQSDTTLGAVFKVGALYRVSKKFSAGMEQTYLANWFSGKGIAGVANLSSIALRFDF